MLCVLDSEKCHAPYPSSVFYRDDKALQEAICSATALSAVQCPDRSGIVGSVVCECHEALANSLAMGDPVWRRERIIQTLQAALDEDGEVAPSPAVSLLERARTIRALPLGADAVKGSLDGLAGGKKASLPQLDDPAKVAPVPAWRWSKHAAGQPCILCECFDCLRCI